MPLVILTQLDRKSLKASVFHHPQYSILQNLLFLKNQGSELLPSRTKCRPLLPLFRCHQLGFQVVVLQQVPIFQQVQLVLKALNHRRNQQPPFRIPAPLPAFQSPTSSLPYPSLLHGVNVAADKITPPQGGVFQNQRALQPCSRNPLAPVPVWTDPCPGKAPPTRKTIPAGTWRRRSVRTKTLMLEILAHSAEGANLGTQSSAEFNLHRFQW